METKKMAVVPIELVNKIFEAFDEMPRRYNSLITPLQVELSKCHVTDVTFEKKEDETGLKESESNSDSLLSDQSLPKSRGKRNN